MGTNPHPKVPGGRKLSSGLRLRLPTRSRATAKRRGPACGPRQVIDRRNAITGEHRRINIGGVTSQVDSPQAGAGIKRFAPDGGDADANRNVGQAAADTESKVAYVGDGIAYRNAGQVGAAEERLISDTGDAVGDCNTG